MVTGSVPCGIAIPQTFVNPRSDLPLIRNFVVKAETLPYDSLWVRSRL